MRRHVIGSLGPLLLLAATCDFVVGQTKNLDSAIQVDGDAFDFVKRDGELEIFLDGQSFATYVWSDRKTTRPYFKQVRALGGEVQVTRNHPPRESDFQDPAHC